MPSIISQMGQNATTTTPARQMTQNDMILENIRSMSRQLQNTSNPSSFLQNMVMSNPNLKQAMNLIQMAGNPQKAMETLAQQRGLDLSAVMRAIQGK